jgi:hypothetical protein
MSKKELTNKGIGRLVETFSGILETTAGEMVDRQDSYAQGAHGVAGQRGEVRRGRHSS